MGTTTSVPNALVTEDQAAQYLGGLSVRTLQRWRIVGAGPAFVRVGRCVRYRQEDLVRFVEAGVRASTSDPGPAAGRP